MHVVESWFQRTQVDASITLIVEPHVAPLLRANIWHVRGAERDLIVDAGLGIASLPDALSDMLDKPVVAVATHNHVDHTGGLSAFDTRLMHRLEPLAPEGDRINFLLPSTYPAAARDSLWGAGYELPAVLIDALPNSAFDPVEFRAGHPTPTGLLEEGDVVDLGGGRMFTVLHFPGHSPGSIGLWEERTGILFAGDAIYDGPLLDQLPGSSIRDYINTMRRLRELPVQAVHAGHDPSFARPRLLQIANSYLASKTAE